MLDVLTGFLKICKSCRKKLQIMLTRKLQGDLLALTVVLVVFAARCQWPHRQWQMGCIIQINLAKKQRNKCVPEVKSYQCFIYTINNFIQISSKNLSEKIFMFFRTCLYFTLSPFISPSQKFK